MLSSCFMRKARADSLKVRGSIAFTTKAPSTTFWSWLGNQRVFFAGLINIGMLALNVLFALMSCFHAIAGELADKREPPRATTRALYGTAIGGAFFTGMILLVFHGTIGTFPQNSGNLTVSTLEVAFSYVLGLVL